MNSSSASSVSASESGCSSPRSDLSFLTAPSPIRTDADGLEHEGHLSIRMPDLFASVMGMENRVNPHYQRVKARSDADIKRILRLDDKVAFRNSKADFAFLTASWIPDATEDALYVIQIWQEWVFFFDDQFDEGHLSQNPLKAAEEVVEALTVLDTSYPILTEESASLAYLLQKVWLEFKKTASAEHQYRFKFYHKKYMIGLLRQVTANISDVDHVSRSLDSYVEYRRDTIGAEAPYVMMEYVSHRTELTSDFDVKHNIVNVLCSLPASSGGVSTIQQAIDKASDMLDERYATWLAAVAALPSPPAPGSVTDDGRCYTEKEQQHGGDGELQDKWWGPEIDAQVRTLLELYIRIPIGTLHWSFRSGRYFGDKGQEVRETRVMRLKMKQ
ncbi:isoprenoid synthase domain-containing protein [Microdochium trichocladiopsis]|uniref:Isoprenoid synthase domain-containing protein n=1 Tax=Microdochium trichocladiopsis TaxID=1682393 RepID=A0A9P9BU39_9PEZI|nr:isoprenoid synthase domain-containing protein [Microdochium trichocladiopsis]KAH7037064.1 isoprenoid synthase domain-containing protein [Microdochium trichocladiopsis]